jgi:tetratricopeptide (TPR) repeat protein
MLSDVGLVHRDVKPENILFFNGQPCLGDISLLGADASVITRRGTPGYASPSWYVGGHPDMYGAAATLYALLTGNSPDKMGRSTFLWPPQGETSLSSAEKAEWKRIHAIIRRCTDEKVSERYVDFTTMLAALRNQRPPQPKLPKFVVSTLTVIGIAAATIVAAFRVKLPTTPQPARDSANNTTSSKSTKVDEHGMTSEEREDYVATVGMIQGYMKDGKFSHALVAVDGLLENYPQARTQPAYSLIRAIALCKLGRTDEAKIELGKEVHVSPQIAAMRTRKELWESMGDLAAAENDLTRIMEKFGPNLFPLVMRADIRAQRGNFAGAHADRQAAWAAKPEDLERRKLVDEMWLPLEKTYPGYADYAKSHPETDPHASHTTSLDQDNLWIHEVLDSLLENLTHPPAALNETEKRGQSEAAGLIRESFLNGNYAACLEAFDQARKSDPSIIKSPAHSLFRCLLLQRLNREDDAGLERVRLCHQDSHTQLIDARICLLSAINRKREARELLDRVMAAIPPSDAQHASETIHLLKLHARILAVLGDFPAVLKDQQSALSLASASLPQQTATTTQQAIRDDWKHLESQYPAYAAFLKSQPKK